MPATIWIAGAFLICTFPWATAGAVLPVFCASLIGAFYCPVTRHILDQAPFGLTPYGIEEKVEDRRRAIPITMPQHPAPMLGRIDVTDAREMTREWIGTDAVIADLRAEGA